MHFLCMLKLSHVIYLFTLFSFHNAFYYNLDIRTTFIYVISLNLHVLHTPYIRPNKYISHINLTVMLD
jgi:hypothetical protein